MSLDLNKLEKVRHLGDGAHQARCPACAEGGQDRKGEHLRIQADGKFGCCVFPQDRRHRQRIFALAGDRQPRVIKVRAPQAKATTAIKESVLGRLGRVFQSRTNIAEEKREDVGTLGTPLDSLREGKENSYKKLIGFAQSVPGVPTAKVEGESDAPVPSVPGAERTPYLLPSGNLIIPFDCPRKYRWWAGGQSRAQTMEEFGARHPARKRST